MRWPACCRPKTYIIGPWRSELGFEVLYWLPWLAKWRGQHGEIPPDRLAVVTRGGAGAWYPDVAERIDLFQYVSPTMLRRQSLIDSAKQQSIKQLGVTSWERAMIRMIAEDRGMQRYGIVHPSQMYQSCSPWWNGDWGLKEILARLHIEKLVAPLPPVTIPLPTEFVAVHFYARHTWPYSAEISSWVVDVVARLVKNSPVVILATGTEADEHIDMVGESGPLRLAPYVTPSNNLAVLAGVLGRAKAFVGTYGGTMQLAVRMGIPALGFYQHLNGTAYAHKVLTEWIGVQQQTLVCITRPNDAGILDRLL